MGNINLLKGIKTNKSILKSNLKTSGNISFEITNPDPATSFLGPEINFLGPEIRKNDSEITFLGFKTVNLGPEITFLGSEIVNLGFEIKKNVLRCVYLGSEIVVLGPEIVILGSEIVVLGLKTTISFIKSKVIFLSIVYPPRKFRNLPN